MKRIAWLVLAVVSTLIVKAEDGSRLWLRYDRVEKAEVTGPKCIAAEELRNYYCCERVNLVLDATMAKDAYRIEGSTIAAKDEIGLLYGAYALLRGETGYSAPFWKLRILNHWDNLDGSIERGYAGKSIFWDGPSHHGDPLNTPIPIYPLPYSNQSPPPFKAPSFAPPLGTYDASSLKNHQ